MRLFEKVSQRRPLDRPVGRHRQLQDLAGGVLLKTDVAAALTNHHPAVTLEGVHDLAIVRARQIRAAMPECRSIFVLPPSRPALEQRLRGRGTDSSEVIARRLRDAVTDMSHWNEFDYVVVNDDFEKAVADLRRILSGSGDDLRASRPALAPLIGGLLAP
mgnify:CR=1 FL=1